MNLSSGLARSSPQGDGIGNDTGTTSEEAGDWLKRESDVLRTIGPHPSIVSVVEQPADVFAVEKPPYSCEEAWELMKHKKSATWCIKRRYKWCLDLSEALAHVHSRHFVHGNLNAGDVRFTENYKLKLANFSMAEVGGEDDEAVADDTTLSTGGNHSSERRAPADHVRKKSRDIFNLGKTMRHLMSLKLDQELEGTGEEHSAKTTDLDDPMGELITLCCHPAPSKSISPSEVADRINEIIKDEGRKARSP